MIRQWKYSWMVAGDELIFGRGYEVGDCCYIAKKKATTPRSGTFRGGTIRLSSRADCFLSVVRAVLRRENDYWGAAHFPRIMREMKDLAETCTVMPALPRANGAMMCDLEYLAREWAQRAVIRGQ